jgi:hypothetical protein
MRRALLLVGVLPLLMGAGPCEDDPAAPATDGGAAGTTGNGGTGGGTAGAAGTRGTAGTTGAAGTGTGTSCADRFQPIENAVVLFQGTWLLDKSPTKGTCGEQFTLSIQPWMFNPAVIPPDPTPVSGCPGVYVTITPKVLDTTVCDLPAFCPTEQSGQGFWVHPVPKNSASPIAPSGIILSRGGPDDTWVTTDLGVRVDLAGQHLHYEDTAYTRTGIVSGTCTTP